MKSDHPLSLDLLPSHHCACCMVVVAVQEDMESMLASVDKSLHGAETGKLSKLQVREALDAFFMVGQPGGKARNRFDEIMQASTH